MNTNSFFGIICWFLIFFLFDLLFFLFPFFLFLLSHALRRSGLSWRTCSVCYVNREFFCLRSRNFFCYFYPVAAAHCCSLPLFETWFSVWQIYIKTCVKYCLQLLWFVHLGFWVSVRWKTVSLKCFSFLSAIKFDELMGGKIQKFHGVKDI